MKKTITVPDYMSIEQYQIVHNSEHLTELHKTIKIISLLTGVSEAELKTWGVRTLGTIYRDLNNKIDLKEEFHPIFKYEDKLYGFQNIDNMTLGEYIDLERLSKEPNKNLHEIMAIFYREIKSHNFNHFVWKQAQKILVNNKKTTNIFKQYKVKKYDVDERHASAEMFKQLPVQYALGALAFFLGIVSGYLTITKPYSTKKQMRMNERITKSMLNHLVNIGGGLRQFINSPNQIFSLSQGTKVSLT